jgi:hypothetical protein
MSERQKQDILTDELKTKAGHMDGGTDMGTT